jgi:hypothetical protein
MPGVSHRIEYQWAVFRVPATAHGLDEDRFVVAIEGGDSNVFERATGRPARSWTVGMIGTATQVLKQAVSAAASCEGAMLRPEGRRCTPEAYIRRIRRVLARPTPVPGRWIPAVRVAPEHPAAREAVALGLVPEMERRFAVARAVFTFPTHRLSDFFTFVDTHADDLSPWQLAQVAGLPPS